MKYTNWIRWIVIACWTPLCICFTTPLRKMVTFQAVTSSISTVVNREFITDSTIYNDLFSQHYHIEADFIYTFILSFTLLYEYNQYSKKWNTIYIYTREQKIVMMITMFMFILLTRNVNSAS